MYVIVKRGKTKVRNMTNNNVAVGEYDLVVVNQCKHLGHKIKISSDAQNMNDVESNIKFYVIVNGNLKSMIIFLFNSYCRLNYGSCLWNDFGTLKCIRLTVLMLLIFMRLKEMLVILPSVVVIKQQ